MMVKAIRIHQTGGPEALVYEDVAIGEPGPGEVRMRNEAIGLNFIDVYFRTGLYPSPSGLPLIPGNEGAGVVLSVGPGVTDVKAGDRVAYVNPIGAYAQERIMPADRLVKVPDAISFQQAGSMMLKGMTAYYLLRETFPVKQGDTILFHAAAGGVGLIAGQWAKHLGATVIGTAGSDEKVKLALENGFDHVINYRTENFVERVKEITGGKGVDVALDCTAGAGTIPILLGIEALKRKAGIIVAQGELKEFPNFPLEKFTVKFITMKSARGHSYRACELALEQIASRRFPLELVTTHRFGLNDVDKAIKAVGGEGVPDVIHASLMPWL